ncbi:hypothetical protein GQR58_007373 [Nymphon striatum]|nr:hypothetical protein GQR58_007373 [Nymphon striatum]
MQIIHLKQGPVEAKAKRGGSVVNISVLGLNDRANSLYAYENVENVEPPLSLFPINPNITNQHSPTDPMSTTPQCSPIPSQVYHITTAYRSPQGQAWDYGHQRPIGGPTTRCGTWPLTTQSGTVHNHPPISHSFENSERMAFRSPGQNARNKRPMSRLRSVSRPNIVVHNHPPIPHSFEDSECMAFRAP